MKPAGISGYVVIRNGIELDYCFREAITSLLPICDEVVVCDSDSTDGTGGALEELCAKNAHIRIINYPFVPAVADRDWYDRWLNFARSHLRFSSQLQLDADEVLSPIDSDLVRDAALRGECRLVHHVNLWIDALHTTIWGDGKVARVAPSDYYMQSHGRLPDGEKDMRAEARKRYSIGIILHYGLLRRQSAFCAKQNFLLKTLEGTTDEVLNQAERDGLNYMALRTDNVIEPFLYRHPDMMLPWLKERGRL